MAIWTLATLQARIRLLTGKPTQNELSDGDLTARINEFYRETLPGELQPTALDGYWAAVVNSAGVPGTGELLAIPDDVITLREPMTLDLGTATGVHDPNFFYDPYTDTPDSSFNLLIVDTDPQPFYSIWPNTQIWSPDRPYHVLLYGRNLLFRPPPDGTYTFRAPAYLKPALLVLPTDAILRDAWGRYLARGTAIQILEDEQDSERLAALITLMPSDKAQAMQPEFSQRAALKMRPAPKW